MLMARRLGLQSPQPGQVHSHGRNQRCWHAGDGQRNAGRGGIGASNAAFR